MMAEAWECPICMTLPEGAVHQCNEGHCYCADCWNRLDPRRCPECRQPVAKANRNRAAERAIATLEWSCEHCGETTTRGAKAIHLLACPQVPTVCAASAAGCGWAGMASEQAAHEAACPFAICHRIMAPLQAQNQQLQSECQELRAMLEPLQTRCDRLHSELMARVAPLQRVGDGADDASSPWARCAPILRIALEAMPYGDAPPAEVSDGKLSGPLSVGQLLVWGDKLQADDGPKPPEEILLRWASHTLTTLAAVNRSCTAAAVRAVADSLEASPPDACLLPPQLLLRYGPSALRQQLLAIPDEQLVLDLSNLAGWMRAAAGVRDLADRAAGWQRLLAGLAATPAAPAPPDS